jgi:Trk K+ transport system NAD-binding subunit
MDSMRALIVGCGWIGRWLAQELIDKGTHVTIIDNDPENLRRLSSGSGDSKIADACILGDGTLREDLERAGIMQADVLISTLNRDASNLFTAQLAREGFGVGQVICITRGDPVPDVYHSKGIEVFNITLLVGQSLVASIKEL